MKQLAAETRALALFASLTLHRILDPDLDAEAVGGFPPEMLQDLLRAMQRVLSDRWKNVEMKKGIVDLGDHYETSQWLIEIKTLLSRWSTNVAPLAVQLVPRDPYGPPEPSYEALRIAVDRFIQHTLHGALREMYDEIRTRYTLVVDAPAWAYVF